MLTTDHVTRRRLLQALSTGVAGCSMSGLLPALADAPKVDSARRRHCVLLWMSGGPSQIDTFDPKPGHKNGGPFKSIETASPGLRISEHLPRLAKQSQHLAVLRGLSSKEGDHGRGTFMMRTGRSPDPVIRHPTVGAFLSKELERDDVPLPGYVAVNPYVAFDPAAFEPGFLGSRHAALTIKPANAQPPANGFATLGVDDLKPVAAVSSKRSADRIDLLQGLQSNLTAKHPAGPVKAHATTLQRTLQLVGSEAGSVFDLTRESDAVRERYGRGTFGQGCLLARRLIEQGVAFVEVSLGDAGRWDTHANNFAMVQELSGELDAGWSSLMEDLAERGLLESTTFLWLGEFGRTPTINGGTGRDHYPNAWSAVLAGGGIKGGQAWGRTSADGMKVDDGLATPGDLLATLCSAVGVDPSHQNISDIGRPFKLADGQPVEGVLA